MKVIKGAPIAKRIRKIVIEDMKEFFRFVPNPQLNVLLVGNEPSSRWYAGAKVKLGKMLGITVNVIEYREEVETGDLIALINNWNTDSAVNGIIIELPLPAKIDDEILMMAIDPIKDVDGVTAVNRALLLGGNIDKAILPATPLACIEIAKEVVPNFIGKRVVVVGRGYTVGRPLASLLLTEHATVTVCHIETRNLSDFTKNADIIISAAGVVNLVNKDNIKEGVIIVDVGINRIVDETAPRGYRIVGDCDYKNIKDMCNAITPVPGGVGPMTIAMLLENVLHAYKHINKIYI